MQPQQIILHKKSATLEVIYADTKFTLVSGYLRMKSPSADNKDKTHVFHPNVTIDQVTSVGNYAMQVQFSDGHNTGIYSWDYVRLLCVTQQAEMAKIAAAEQKDTQVLRVQPAPEKK